MTSMAQYKHNRSRMMALIAEHAPTHGHSAALADAHGQQVTSCYHCIRIAYSSIISSAHTILLRSSQIPIKQSHTSQDVVV